MNNNYKFSNGKTGLETMFTKLMIVRQYLSYFYNCIAFNCCSYWFVNNINLSAAANVLIHVTFCLMNHDKLLTNLQLFLTSSHISDDSAQDQLLPFPL